MRLSKEEVQPLIDHADRVDAAKESGGVGVVVDTEALYELGKLVRSRQAQLDARMKPIPPEPANPGEVVFGAVPDEEGIAQAVKGAVEMGEMPEGLATPEDGEGFHLELTRQDCLDVVWSTLARFPAACCRDVAVTLEACDHVLVHITGVAGAAVPDVEVVRQRIVTVFAPQSCKVTYAVSAL